MMRKALFSSLTLCALLLTLLAPLSTLAATRYDLSEAGLSFIAQHEVFRGTVYAIDGTWYIGYGTPCAQNAYPSGISEAEAMKLLHETLSTHVTSVNDFLAKHSLSLTQSQFDALVSFTASLGATWMDPSYRLSSHLISGISKQTDVEIVDSMAVWCHSGGKVVEKYLQRRIDEARLLLYADYTAANSPAFYALTFDLKGGTLVAPFENDTICYPSGKRYETIPTASRPGYRFDGWYDSTGKQLLATDSASAHRFVEARWSISASLPFTDVAASDWFYSYVYDLTEQGVVSGMTSKSFAPYGTLTYAQALKLILLAAGQSEQAPTGKHWASGYLDLAAKQGFLPSASVNLDQSISRLALAKIAAKALALPDPTGTSPFSDCSEPAVLSLYEAGILEGSRENNVLVYKPNSNITRAEISAIIWRMAHFHKGEGEIPSPTPTPTPDPTPEPKPEPTPEPKPAPSEQFLYQGKWLDVLPTVAKNPYQQSLFYKENGLAYYRSNQYTYETGIDVSSYQGDINWQKVKDAGIDYAIIRVGGRGWGSEGAIYADKKFHQNMKGASDVGLKLGVYFFSQAITVEEAIEEARYTLDQMKGYTVTYPVAFDWEIVSNDEARTTNIDPNVLSAAAVAFCREVENAGQHPIIYFNSPCGYLKYDLSQINQYDFWYAQYNAVPTFYYSFDMWQYTSSGTVPGIPGRVDMNLYFHKK